MVIFGIGGLAFIYCSISVLVRIYKLKKNGIEVDATVIKTERIETGRGRKWIHYSAIFRYTVDGKEYERFDAGFVKPKFFDGETVAIYVDKNNPEKFHVKKDKIQFFGSIFFMVIGSVLIFAAINMSLR